MLNVSMLYQVSAVDRLLLASAIGQRIVLSDALPVG